MTMALGTESNGDPDEPPDLQEHSFRLPYGEASPTVSADIISISAAKAPRVLRTNPFPVSPTARAFYKQFFPGSTSTQWME
ncbi:MAG: hypothetical protein O3C28_14975 [Proteobacteria bacterium]|nr:hypothetical protein [Pseudomonadota bacterium]